MKLFAHQKEAIELALKKPVLLQHDCGTGKTCTSLHIIDALIKRGFGPALVVCQLSIIEAAWLEDAKKFMPHLSTVSLWHEPGPKKAKYQQKMLADNHDIYIANFETFKALYDALKARRFGILIVDESSKMKNYRSSTTKALLSLAGIGYRSKGGSSYTTETVIPWRYCLSGTPAPNCEDEYWPQCKFITGRGNDVFSDNSSRSEAAISLTASPTKKGARPGLEDLTGYAGRVQRAAQGRLSRRPVGRRHIPSNQVHEVRHVVLSPKNARCIRPCNVRLILGFGVELFWPDPHDQE